MADEREGGRALGRRDALDTPLETRRPLVRPVRVDQEAFGRLSEGFARFMGTPRFLFLMTVVVIVWLAYNTLAPAAAQFDPRATNYTLLTLILSLQASYAAPLILLAQNRQADRDRVALEQDRQGAERNLADTEYLAREVAGLRIALGEVATRDFVRSELRALLAELDRGADGEQERQGGSGEREGRERRGDAATKRARKQRRAKAETEGPEPSPEHPGPEPPPDVRPSPEQQVSADTPQGLHPGA